LPSVPTALLSCQGGDKQDKSAFSIYNKTPILHFVGMPKYGKKNCKTPLLWAIGPELTKRV
jgi:hypothetical protein